MEKEVNSDEATEVADRHPGRDAGGLVLGSNGFLCGGLICTGGPAGTERPLRLLRLRHLARHLRMRKRVPVLFHDDPSLLLQSLP